MSHRHQLYTVTLTDLGEYTVTVAAANVDEAKRIATSVLHEEATTLPDGLSIVKRQCDATAVLADNPAPRTFDVSATYMLDFSMVVPAANRTEAEQHARRLYEENAGPFEFVHDGDRVGSFHAREVVS
jgi:hypothetical protein